LEQKMQCWGKPFINTFDRDGPSRDDEDPT
jgi:hypothetical protein